MPAATLCQAPLAKGVRAALPARRAHRLVVRAAAPKQTVQEALVKATTLAGLSAALLSAGSAQAAMEVANIAAGDGRGGILALLAVPVVGWVGFNILGPLQNQLADMSEKNGASASRKRGIAAGLGLTAAGLMATQSAEAAQQVADLAASDNRLGTIGLLALPVLGWVLFNILGPLQNQMADMSEKKDAPASRKRGIAAGLGLTAAGLMATQSAEAAQQVADLAAGDGRGGILALLAVPVVGWVGFNILGPLQNQLADMSEKNGASASRKRGIAAGLGLTAAGLMATQSAEAAQQVADLAAGDGRGGILALLAVPVVGWVGFNILGPLQNQLADMSEKNGAPVGKGRK